MKLLFDHNLPPSLVTGLRNLFPDSEHVFAIGLDRSSDLEIREYARREGLVIVTKDADFSDMCVLKGFPPKIIWIRRGNCSAHDVEELLRQHHMEIEDLEADPYFKIHEKEVRSMRLTEMVSCSG
jgi:predicted nuclease of predicted toxin-antitoxin system